MKVLKINPSYIAKVNRFTQEWSVCLCSGNCSVPSPGVFWLQTFHSLDLGEQGQSASSYLSLVCLSPLGECVGSSVGLGGAAEFWRSWLWGPLRPRAGGGPKALYSPSVIASCSRKLFILLLKPVSSSFSCFRILREYLLLFINF